MSLGAHPLWPTKTTVYPCSLRRSAMRSHHLRGNAKTRPLNYTNRDSSRSSVGFNGVARWRLGVHKRLERIG